MPEIFPDGSPIKWKISVLHQLVIFIFQYARTGKVFFINKGAMSFIGSITFDTRYGEYDPRNTQARATNKNFFY